MRKQFLIPVLVGILALGAAPAFAQSATVVMRNGDRVQAQLLDLEAVVALLHPGVTFTGDVKSSSG